MDDALYQRFLSGDPAATAAVRNHLRAITARVVEAPQWKIGQVEVRRRLEQEAAGEAMAEPRPEAFVACIRKAMRSATRRCIEQARLQEATPRNQIDADLLAGVALEVVSAAQAQQVEEALALHPHSKVHLEMARQALRAAVSAQRSLATQARPPDAPKGPNRPEAAQRTQRPRRRPPEKQRKEGLPLWIQAAPLLLLLAVAAYALNQRGAGSADQVTAAIAQLLPAELPPTDRANDYEGITREAIIGIRSGRCERAITRLESAANADPGDTFLRYYQGLAAVCARQGAPARMALEQVRAQASDPPFGLDWWLAQALLLDGDLVGGVALLDELSATRHPRAPYAAALAAEIRVRFL